MDEIRNYRQFAGVTIQNNSFTIIWREHTKFKTSFLVKCFDAFKNHMAKNKDTDPITCSRFKSSSEFYNPSFLLPRICHYTKFKGTPALLVNLGVLGTFLGLIEGIGGAGAGLASSDPDTTRQALKTLLSGSSTAFITSLAGLGTATLYSHYLKHSHSTLESGFHEISDKIDSLIEGEYRELLFIKNTTGHIQDMKRSIYDLIRTIRQSDDTEQMIKAGARNSTDIIDSISQFEKCTIELFSRLHTKIDNALEKSQQNN
jgi:hypothetical protein